MCIFWIPEAIQQNMLTGQQVSLGHFIFIPLNHYHPLLCINNRINYSITPCWISCAIVTNITETELDLEANQFFVDLRHDITLEVGQSISLPFIFSTYFLVCHFLSDFLVCFSMNCSSMISRAHIVPSLYLSQTTERVIVVLSEISCVSSIGRTILMKWSKSSLKNHIAIFWPFVTGIFPTKSLSADQYLLLNGFQTTSLATQLIILFKSL